MRASFKSLTLVFCMVCLFGTVAEARIKFKHYLRFEIDGTISYGELRAGWVYELSAAPFEGGEPTGKQYTPTSVKLLAPVTPANVYSVTSNYAGSNVEYEKNSELKLVSALEEISLSANNNSNYAGTMVIIIGKNAQNISVENAKDYVFGVTGGNRFNNTLAAVGPVLVTGINFDQLRLETRVDGEVVQSATTADMQQNIATIVSNISQNHALMAGDIIFTGTPGNTGTLKAGNRVVVTLEGVGGLSNTLKATD